MKKSDSWAEGFKARLDNKQPVNYLGEEWNNYLAGYLAPTQSDLDAAEQSRFREKMDTGHVVFESERNTVVDLVRLLNDSGYQAHYYVPPEKKMKLEREQ